VLPRPEFHWRQSELSDAYGEFYNPNYGAMSTDDIRRAEQLGWVDTL